MSVYSLTGYHLLHGKHDVGSGCLFGVPVHTARFAPASRSCLMCSITVVSVAIVLCALLAICGHLLQQEVVLHYSSSQPGLPHRLLMTYFVELARPMHRCVMGNCFSLQREHESAIKFFQRALQLDPSMAYAATLAGHEYLAGESFEEAMMAYRTALRADGRHYNAL